MTGMPDSAVLTMDLWPDLNLKDIEEGFFD